MNNKTKIIILILIILSFGYKIGIALQGEIFLKGLRSELYPKIDSSDYVIQEITIHDNLYYFKNIDYAKKPNDRKIGESFIFPVLTK